jgi:hypothetical protein
VTSEEVKAAWGRKVFFLNPHSVFNEELFMEIMDSQYEIYVLKNHEALWKAAAVFPGSIVFVNVDDTLSEKDWEAWVRKLLADRERSSTRVGILTYNVDQALAKTYLMEIGVPCGFIQLKQGLVESKRIILKTLEANEARGRRRYVRARCMDPQKATFNVKFQGRLVTGVIVDISAAGMTFRLDKPLPLKANAIFEDIQLKLKGVLCRVSGTFVGEVKEGGPRNLLMFRHPIASNSKEKIHRFIFYSLQQEMESAIGMSLIAKSR